MLQYIPTQTAAWGDFDRDGFLDLFIGNESNKDSEYPCDLYRNNQDGTFTNVAHEYGVSVTGFVKGVVWGDYDNDGWPDLYISRHQEDNILFRNEGVGNRFRDVTKEAGVAGPTASFSVWFWDYNNDGLMDIFVSKEEN